MYIDNTKTITASVNKEADIKDIKWTISDENIATLKVIGNEAQIFAAEFLLDDDILYKYHGQSIFDIAREEYVSVELVKLKLINLHKSNSLNKLNNLEESNFDDYHAI